MSARSVTDRARSRARLRRIAECLVGWFSANARDLPWRKRRSAYRTLVSEIMLQQTQAERVADRFTAFVARFPSLRSLAQADEQDVLHAWQGLGYYSRARHLHATARKIVTEYGGRVPRTVEELMTLPGVGRYTAGAVASIAGGRPAAIVDGNVRRVLARLFERVTSADDPEESRWMWQTAERLVNESAMPGTLNEALMELGATVCRPVQPNCPACPLARFCQARRNGRTHEIPVPNRRTERKQVFHHVVVIRRGRQFLIERRPPRGLWAGLWQFPTVESESAIEPQRVGSVLKLELLGLEKREQFNHRTTHRDVKFFVYSASTPSRHGTWVTRDSLGKFAMGNPQRRILAGLR